MSDEKIDLADLAELADHAGQYEPKSWAFMRACDVLALVRAARAAIVVAADPLSTDAVRRLDSALAPFTDSAEAKE